MDDGGDNADNEEVMLTVQDAGSTTQEASAMSSAVRRRPLSGYLPTSTHGSIVITSRSREVAEGLIEYVEDILDVGPMSSDDAVAMLNKKLRRQDQAEHPDDRLRLVQELDCMPLAISQAAAYIHQRAPRVTVPQYLSGLRLTDLDRADLLQVDIRDPRRDGQASNSIIVTWHVSFEHIRQTRDSAARLLALMCLFDREAIPEYLLQGQYSQQDPEERSREVEKTRHKRRLEDDIATLRAYSLIGVGASDELFDMRRLVQFSTKKWLELHDELGRWQTRYARILSAALPTGDHANWPRCQALFPHVEALMTYRVESEGFLRDRAAAAYRGAWYAWASGKYGAAEKMARVSLEDRRRLLSEDHAETLASVGLIAQVLQYQGKYSEAEEMNRRALAGSEKELGVNHPDTLASVYCLANLLHTQHGYTEALWLYDRAVKGYHVVLSPSHPTTLACQRHRQSLLRDMNLESKGREAAELRMYE